MGNNMKPLQGIRIADFTVHAAGPFCTHMLSQLGAECIKIESLLRPDIFRKPHPVYGRLGAATFDQAASNKLSVRVNLKHPKGVALAKRLVGISDIAAESFRPGVMDRLGLSYEALREARRDIIFVSVSSSGQTGPDSHFAGYAPLFGAWGGLGYLTGYADGPPVEMRHVMDHSLGMNAALATVAAMLRRRATGEPQRVDVAAREVAASFIGEALLQAAAGDKPVRSGNDHPAMAPHGVFPSKDYDRWVTIAVGSEMEWQGLIQSMQQTDIPNNPIYATQASRCEHREELNDIISGWTKLQDADKIVSLLQSAGVPAHVSWNARDIVEDKHLRQRRAIVDVHEPGGNLRAAVGVPIRLSKSPDVGIEMGTPRLGEHEDYVFGELLGMAATERRVLQDEQVIY